ncbi:MAG: tetratricopeptide repeat protein [Chitinophagaceae bacterium]
MKNIYLFASIVLSICMASCGVSGKKTDTIQPKDGVFAHPSVASISLEIEADPKNAALFFKRAKALRDLNEDSIALKDFEHAVALDSTKAKYFSAIGELLFEHKDVDGSVKWFKKAIQIDPKDPVAHLKYAKMLVFIGENQKAFTEINTVLRQDPYNSEAYFLKGVVYKTMKDTAKAISSFQTSVQVDPQYQPSILQLALIYAARQDSLSLRYFDNAYAADTTQLVALYGKAMFCQDNGQFDKAKAIYKKCIIREPQYADAYFNTGWILMHEDSLEKAARQFDFVVKIEPDNAEAYYNRGLCYEMMKKPEQAIGDYRQALEFAPGYKEPKDGINRLSK